MSRRLTLWFVYWVNNDNGAHIAFEYAKVTLCGQITDTAVNTTEQDIEAGKLKWCHACLAMKRAATAAAEGTR